MSYSETNVDSLSLRRSQQAHLALLRSSKLCETNNKPDGKNAP